MELKQNCNDAVRVVNPAQASAYWCNGIEPIDIYPSRDFNTGKPIIVFVFSKAKTQGFYDLWCKHELK